MHSKQVFGDEDLVQQIDFAGVQALTSNWRLEEFMIATRVWVREVEPVGQAPAAQALIRKRQVTSDEPLLQT